MKDLITAEAITLLDKLIASLDASALVEKQAKQ